MCTPTTRRPTSSPLVLVTLAIATAAALLSGCSDASAPSTAGPTLCDHAPAPATAATATAADTRSAAAQRALPAWYDDAKLGIMIHWGVWAVAGWAETT